jgi:hypothetical protein
MSEEPAKLPPFVSNVEVGSVGIKGQEVRDTTVNLSINTKFFLKVLLARLLKLNMPLLGKIKQLIDEIYFAYI